MPLLAKSGRYIPVEGMGNLLFGDGHEEMRIQIRLKEWLEDHEGDVAHLLDGPPRRFVVK